VTRDDFAALMERLAAGWNSGDAAGAAACFAEDVDYRDPLRYGFGSRAALLPFFEPPPSGHRVTWHRILFDDTVQTGVVEYTYEGHHRYHGAAVAAVDANGRISAWREWQHLDDERDWTAYLAEPNGPI
jgi:SnoaL-like domain